MIDIKGAKAFIGEVRAYAVKNGRKPGTWYKFHNHVYGVAEVARLIAEKTAGLNPERAYVLGMLHDAGKIQEEFEQRFHGLLGYELLKDKDAEAARASMLHMFPYNKIPPYEKVSMMFFDKHEDYAFVKAYADTHPINDYDRLIQLADCLADSRGIVTMEQRAADFARRYHCEISKEMSEPRMQLKHYFDEKIGCNIYSLFNKIPKAWMLREGTDR